MRLIISTVVVFLFLTSLASAEAFYIICKKPDIPQATGITVKIDTYKKTFSRIGMWNGTFYEWKFAVDLMTHEAILATFKGSKQIQKQKWLINRINGEANLHLNNNVIFSSILICHKTNTKF